MFSGRVLVLMNMMCVGGVNGNHWTWSVLVVQKSILNALCYKVLDSLKRPNRVVFLSGLQLVRSTSLSARDGITTTTRRRVMRQLSSEVSVKKQKGRIVAVAFIESLKLKRIGVAAVIFSPNVDFIDARSLLSVTNQPKPFATFKGKDPRW